MAHTTILHWHGDVTYPTFRISHHSGPSWGGDQQADNRGPQGRSVWKPWALHGHPGGVIVITQKDTRGGWGSETSLCLLDV